MFVSVFVRLSVWVCVRALAFKGAPSLAHVSMRVRVHLCGDAWSDAAWAHSVWPLTFLQCCRVAVSRVPECQTTPPSPPLPSPPRPSSPPLLTPWAPLAQPGLCTFVPGTKGLISDRRCCVSLHEFRTAEGEGVARKCTFLLKVFEKKKKNDFHRNSSGEGEKPRFTLPKKKPVTDRGRSCSRWKRLDVSVLYCLLAAIFAVVVTTNDNSSSLDSLHGPPPRLSFSGPPPLPRCSNPINYCAPWRTMNVPILICLFISVSLYYFTNLFSSLSGKWPNLVLIFLFSSSVSFSSLSSYIGKKKKENCYNSNWYRCFSSVYWRMSCRLMTLKMFHYLFYILINKYASCI